MISSKLNNTFVQTNWRVAVDTRHVWFVQKLDEKHRIEEGTLICLHFDDMQPVLTGVVNIFS